MNKYLITVVFIINFSFISFGQEINEGIPKIDLTTIARGNQGNSYFTFPTDIGNIEPLWFEGNIIPNFHIRTSKNSRFMGVLTTQVMIRMYREESFPVKTPSYKPQLTLYYLLSSKTRANSFSLFGRFTHHSNGQDGVIFLDNGDINLKSGSFSTNFYELGFTKTNYNSKYGAVQLFRSSMEFHPEKTIREELLGIYSLYRWNVIFSIFKLPDDSNNNKANISIKGQATWMFGDVYDWEDFSLNRLNLKLTFFYHPKFLEDIGIFVQLYSGMDYYNIYFDHKINIIRFGIMTEKLRF